jgi:hypothetical protein
VIGGDDDGWEDRTRRVRGLSGAQALDVQWDARPPNEHPAAFRLALTRLEIARHMKSGK